LQFQVRIDSGDSSPIVILQCLRTSNLREGIRVLEETSGRATLLAVPGEGGIKTKERHVSLARCQMGSEMVGKEGKGVRWKGEIGW
jgi:hypothetical protein